MSRWRVLLTDRAWPDSSLEREVLEPLGAEVVDAPAGDEATLVELAREVDAIGTNWARVTAAVIQAAPRLRVVSRFGIGLDNIDVAAATARGILVTNVPDYCLDEVADHTLALLFACNRQVAFLHHRTKCGEYQLAAAAPMRRLAGQTLGLIGFGRIGRRVWEKAQSLGVRVIATTPSGNPHGTTCPMVPLDEVLQSDYVSLHLPYTPQSRHVINAGTLARLRPTAYLINTSRGGLIDHAALWTVLQENRLAGAALDVFDPEPPNLADPLFRDERVIVTPHAAFTSVESVSDLRRRAARQIADVLTGQRPPDVVNGL